MSKLYVSCVVVALLALAVMPALAVKIIAPGPLESGDWSEVVVTATVPEYINMDAFDGEIDFPALTATNVGYVKSVAGTPVGAYEAGPLYYGGDRGFTEEELTAGASKSVISTNVPLWITTHTGSDLNAPDSADSTYKMELQFSSAINGTVEWPSPVGVATEQAYYWGYWIGCGTDQANAPDSAFAYDEQKVEYQGSFAIKDCQTITMWTRAQLYQDGINDPAGAYVQGTKLVATVYTTIQGGIPGW